MLVMPEKATYQGNDQWLIKFAPSLPLRVSPHRFLLPRPLSSKIVTWINFVFWLLIFEFLGSHQPTPSGGSSSPVLSSESADTLNDQHGSPGAKSGKTASLPTLEQGHGCSWPGLKRCRGWMTVARREEEKTDLMNLLSEGVTEYIQTECSCPYPHTAHFQKLLSSLSSRYLSKHTHTHKLFVILTKINLWEFSVISMIESGSIY